MGSESDEHDLPTLPLSGPPPGRAQGPGGSPAGAAGGPAEGALVPGTRYRLIHLLGRGGMGEAWLAEDARGRWLDARGRPVGVVVKFLRDDLANDRARFDEHFRAEAGIGQSLHGKLNLARTHEFLDLSAHRVAGWPPCGFVSKLYSFSLARIFVRLDATGEKMRVETAIELCRHVATGLGELHAAGFVHRDLKPANILADCPNGDEIPMRGVPEFLIGTMWHLADFGGACRSGAEPPFPFRPENGARWPAEKLASWKPPELFNDAGEPLPKTNAEPAQDIWAFGKLLRVVADHTDGRPMFLLRLADSCQALNPAVRPAADHDLILRISCDYDIQHFLALGGWRPENYPRVIGREWVLREIDAFEADGLRARRGGVFLIEAASGLGKTAIARLVVGEGEHWPCFFFRNREGRTSVRAMAEALIGAVRKRYQVGAEVPVQTERPGVELENLLIWTSANRLGGGAKLRIVVDGLDEAENRREAVNWLPKRPPPGVLLVVASRPPIAGDDHLNPLRSAGAHLFPIDPVAKLNLGDLTRYFREELGDRVSDSDAVRLAHDAARGIFQVAVVICGEIRRGRLTVDEAVTTANLIDRLGTEDGDHRLLGWYAETWTRITREAPPAHESTEDPLELLLALMAAAEAPLAETKICELLGWRGMRKFDWAFDRLVWLLWRDVRRDADGLEVAFVRFQHKSAQDFLTSVQHRGPLRGNPADMHALIAHHYLEAANQRHGWTTIDPYGRYYTVRHVIKSDDSKLHAEGLRLLTDLRYIAATLGAVRTKKPLPGRRVYDVLDDYRKMIGKLSGLDVAAAEREKFEAFRQFLERYEDLLADDPNQLVQVAHNQCATSPVRVAAVADDSLRPRGVWFRRLHQPLDESQAGGGFHRQSQDGETSQVAIVGDGRYVVSGGHDGRVVRLEAARGGSLELGRHGGPVNCVAISHDGARAVSGGDDGKVIAWDVQTGTMLATLHWGRRINELAWSDRASRLVLGDDTGAVAWFQFEES